MNSHSTISNPTPDWTRVSSSKPYVIGLLLTAIVSATLLILLRMRDGVLPLITAGTLIAIGLIALNWKVVHRRGREYRISTLFYAEVVTADDICMTVKNPGPLWTDLRIHLRRPARFGWRISFVPANESLNNNAGASRPAQK